MSGRASAESVERAPGGPAGLVALVAAGIGVLVVRELAWLVGPLVLAALVIVVVHPVHRWLRALGAPGPVAVGGVVVAGYGLLGSLLAVVAYALWRAVEMLPEYLPQLRASLTDLAGSLGELGMEVPSAAELREGLDVAGVLAWLGRLLPPLVPTAAALVLLLTVLAFLGVESTQWALRGRGLAVARPRVYAELGSAVRGTRRFLLVTSVFAVVVGALDTVLLAAMGIPAAPLWGVLAAVCNFVPYLGFWIGMAPPALLALGLHGGRAMVVVVVAYLVLNFLVTSVLPTKFVSDAVGLSMTVEVVCIVFWAWVLGPLGAILAVPITIVVKAVLVDADVGVRWLSDLVSSSRSLRHVHS
ncbi:AI-2E family transporter [Cellulomonas sp. ACRRI]|uniref:AI-2E family transporter n=1 Tax=Cellulomonas sp. ACRRI TaxID=2918188 RepID=UPI001EF3B95B|nr:AI-2E family transporter [Cellulomonas sp. ACRRI]MCG7286163.1 AI-2E family transporter [Cellulomonas sp. ACRRI]